MIGADMLVSHSVSGPLFLLFVCGVCLHVCLFVLTEVGNTESHVLKDKPT